MNISRFDFQPRLQSASLDLRALRHEDYDAMFECASDKRIWQGHPAHNRYQQTIFKKLFIEAINCRSCLVIREKGTRKVIGWSRYYIGEDHPSDIAIGHTFLCCEHWGGSTNRELKSLMLNYAFEYFSNVWFHVSPSNIRSQKAVLKLGAHLIDEKLLFLAGSEGVWKSYLLEKKAWLQS